MDNHGFHAPIDGIRFGFHRISAKSNKDQLVLSVNGVEGHLE